MDNERIIEVIKLRRDKLLARLKRGNAREITTYLQGGVDALSDCLTILEDKK